jgi:hypothetical protein
VLNASDQPGAALYTIRNKRPAMTARRAPGLGERGASSRIGEVCFSNRPFWVKRFQTIHQSSVDVAHGLVLLFGIGTKALVWDFFSQEVQAWWRIFFSSSFFADLKVRFFFLSRLRSRDACQATL